MTFNKYRCHITPLYKNLKILKLNDIYQFELAKFMHKFHYGKLPEIYNEFFQEAFSAHQARNQLGTPGGAKSFLRGPKFFELCPIVLNYVQHIFP